MTGEAGLRAARCEGCDTLDCRLSIFNAIVVGERQPEDVSHINLDCAD